MDTETPTATPTPTLEARGIYVPLPAASNNTVSIYFIQVGGGNVACGDRLIAVSSGAERTGDIEDDIKAGLQKLFSYTAEYVGDLYNPLHASRLKVQKVDFSSASGAVEIILGGTYKPSGDACDNQRVRAQVWTTVRQFRGVEAITIYLNRVPFGDRLSNDN